MRTTSLLLLLGSLMAVPATQAADEIGRAHV